MKGIRRQRKNRQNLPAGGLTEDYEIIGLYYDRSEDAIAETDVKYGSLCRHIAVNILASREDVEECVNDTYLGVWNAIPPKRPDRLSAFIGKITRNLALKRYEYLSAGKRNPEASCSLSELEECVSGQDSVESELEKRRIEKAISDFLWSENETARWIFIRRYWYFDSIEHIVGRSGFSRSKVTSLLFRSRKRLRNYLQKEGISI